MGPKRAVRNLILLFICATTAVSKQGEREIMDRGEDLGEIRKKWEIKVNVRKDKEGVHSHELELDRRK